MTEPQVRWLSSWFFQSLTSSQAPTNLRVRLFEASKVWPQKTSLSWKRLKMRHEAKLVSKQDVLFWKRKKTFLVLKEREKEEAGEEYSSTFCCRLVLKITPPFVRLNKLWVCGVWMNVLREVHSFNHTHILSLSPSLTHSLSLTFSLRHTHTHSWLTH